MNSLYVSIGYQNLTYLSVQILPTVGDFPGPGTLTVTLYVNGEFYDKRTYPVTTEPWVQFSFWVGGLKAETTYTFRVEAELLGVTAEDSITLTTPPPPPPPPKARVVSFEYRADGAASTLKWDGTNWRCYGVVKIQNVGESDGNLWVQLSYSFLVNGQPVGSTFPKQVGWMMVGGTWDTWWGYGYPGPDQIAMPPNKAVSFTVTAGHNAQTDDTKTFPLTTPPAPPPPSQGKGALHIDTTPIKGEVFVDGVSWGTAPQSRSLDPASYTVTFGEMSSYIKPASQTVTVTMGQTTTITGTYTPIPIAQRPSKLLGGIILLGATVMAIGFLFTRK